MLLGRRYSHYYLPRDSSSSRWHRTTKMRSRPHSLLQRQRAGSCHSRPYERWTRTRRLTQRTISPSRRNLDGECECEWRCSSNSAMRRMARVCCVMLLDPHQRAASSIYCMCHWTSRARPQQTISSVLSIKHPCARDCWGPTEPCSLFKGREARPLRRCCRWWQSRPHATR